MGRTVSIDDVPDSIFIEVNQRRNIYSAKIISKQDKDGLKDKSKDVIITDIFGESLLISRNQLKDNYITLNGDSIKLFLWKRGEVRYITKVRDNIKRSGVVLVPRGYVVNIPGKGNIGEGNYLICPIDDTGEYDRERVKPIDAKIFRKIFSIPMCNVVEKSKGVKRYNKISKQVQNKVQKGTVIKAVGRLINNSGVLVGFIVEGIDGGKVSVAKMVELCNAKKVSNVELVDSGGKKHLRGNGIRLSNLKEYRV